MAIFLISSAIAFLFYSLFYFYSPLVWSIYTQLPLQEFTTWTRWALQAHDGIEVFVLYPLTLMVIAVSGVVYALFLKTKGRMVRWGLFLLFAFGAVLYYRSIGFFPPVPEVRTDFFGVVFILFSVYFIGLLARYIDKFTILKGFAVVLLGIICVLPTRWFVTGYDYLYIFTPALRALDGVPLRETYFQYDYLISLLVMGWMKLHLPLSLFYLVGNMSFFVFLIGLYWFAKRHLMNKWLAVYLVAVVMLLRIYADPAEIVIFPQAAPLRLDWWLLIAILGWLKGFRHWIVGVSIGFLLLYHHAFGMIYGLSYVFFVFALFIVDVFGKKQGWRAYVGQYFREYRLNFFVITGALFLYQWLLAPRAHMAALMYQQYNIGFLPIARSSFFWYVPVILGCCAGYLWRNRLILSEKYFQSGVMVIFLAVGNSFYFFGRSDETNVIKISAVLLLALFIVLDMILFTYQASSKYKAIRWFVIVMVMTLAAGTMYCYSGRITARMRAQATNLISGPYEDRTGWPMNTKVVSAVTQGSPKVTFLSILSDFDHYYAMGIVPPHYYSFTNAWIIKKEYINFLNEQLSKGYYLVMPRAELPAFVEIIQGLKSYQMVEVPGYIVMKASQ